MSKQEYIESNISKLFYQWSNIAFLTASIFVILLSALDYLVTPSNFKLFLVYRIVAAALFIVIYLLNKRKINKNYQTAMTFAATLVISCMIELMILKFGGHRSPYFLGFILTMIYVLGFMPLDIKMSLLASSVIYGIYFFPIIIMDTITDKPFFLSINAFILSIVTFIVIWKYFSQKGLINELGLQYDLDQQKQQLKNYSTHLEDLVQERTKELTISEKWHRSLFDNATDGVMVLDKGGQIINVNKKACEIHGFDREALVGVNIELLEAKGNRGTHDDKMTRILKGESLLYETEHYRKDGNKILLEVSANRIEIEGEIYIQAFYRDITEKKRIQEQLMHSQKMDSVGALAGGVAHNFNNILTAILGYAELLLEYSALDDTSKQRVRHIESSARKAGVMVSKLLSFARRESHEVLPISLHDVINDSVKLFEGVLDKRIGLKVILCDNHPTIEGDPNQLEQVIMNLMVNARDAMPDGGLITIRTGLIDVEKDNPELQAYISPGKYIHMAVSDTGCGIPKDIVNRIFDPFFTTKEKGKGTGLGLATVYGIVKDHNGYISVQSEIDKGTTFDIYLPVSRKIVRKVLKPQFLSVEGNENILVVDDDKDVLNYIQDILQTHGYTVMPANSALTAIDIFRNFSGRIPLVITDVIMPLMEGPDLITHLKQIRQDIRVIVVSGYSNEAVSKDKGVDIFIKKPFEGIELLTAVRRLLDTGIKESPLY